VNYTAAYNYVFIGYGLIALIGVCVILYLMGPLHKNEELHEYAESKNQ
jgi:ACS family hexuronate transporter-like MFS transporter